MIGQLWQECRVLIGDNAGIIAARLKSAEEKSEKTK